MKLYLLLLSQENSDFLKQLVDGYDFKTRWWYKTSAPKDYRWCFKHKVINIESQVRYEFFTLKVKSYWREIIRTRIE